jgi:hypothetical protein
MPVYTLDNEDLARAYSALGEFLVEFQITCWNLRFCYLTLLKRHGLANMALAEVLIHSKDMSESLLIDSFRSAYLNAFKDRETQDQIKKAHKRFRDLLEKRTRLCTESGGLAKMSFSWQTTSRKRTVSKRFGKTQALSALTCHPSTI